MPENPYAQFDTGAGGNSAPPNPYAQFAPDTQAAPPTSTMTPAAPAPVDAPVDDPRVPVYMRGNPGLHPLPTTAPSRDIPAATSEQMQHRAPEANLTDWLSFVPAGITDQIIGALGYKPASERAAARNQRILNSLTGVNAESGVTEEPTPITHLRDGRRPNLIEQAIAATTDPDYRHRAERDYAANWRIGLGNFLDQNEEHQATIIRANYPTAEFKRDANGYVQYRTRPGEDWHYINRPGVSATDAGNVAATGVKYLPAGGVASIPTKLGARALTAILSSAGTEYASQQAATTVGGPGADATDVTIAGLGGGGGQVLADTAHGLLPAFLRGVRRRFSGVPEPEVAPTPAPTPQPEATPAPRPDVATRGTPEDIAALEDQLAALHARGPRGLQDITDPTNVRRAVRADEAPQLSEGDHIRGRIARERHAAEVDAIEQQLAAAREPYFPPDTPAPARTPFANAPSDAAYNGAWRMLRTNTVPTDAADPLIELTESRVRGGAGLRDEQGAIQGTTGFDVAPAPGAPDEFGHTRGAQGLISNLAAAIRNGTATFRNVEVLRNTLRGLEEQATGRDADALRLLTLGLDDWTNRAMAHPSLGAVATPAEMADVLHNARTAWLERRAALVPPEPEPPTPSGQLPTPAEPTPQSRQANRDAFDRNRIPGSRGQVSQDMEARQREDDLVQQAVPRALRFTDEQAAAVQRRGEELATRGHPALATGVDDAGDVLRQEVQQQFQRIDELADDTYDEAFTHLGSEHVPSAEADRLGNYVEERLVHGAGPRAEPTYQDNFTGFTPNELHEMPALRRAMNIINSLRENMNLGNRTFAAVERTRQNLRAIAEGAKGNDIEAVRLVRHGFDEWLTDALERGQTGRIFSEGDATAQAASQANRARASDLIREARAIWGERQRLFSGGPRDPGGAAIERLRDPSSEMTGTQVINSVFGSGREPPLAAVGALRRILSASMETAPSGRLAEAGTITDAARAFADNGARLPPAMQALREAMWARILKPITSRRPGQLVPAKAIAENLDRALNGPGTAITRMLHNDAEIAQMRDYLHVLRLMERPVGANTSGTAATAMRMLRGSADALASTLPRSVSFIVKSPLRFLNREATNFALHGEAVRRFSRPALEVDFGRSSFGAPAGELMFHGDRSSRFASPDRTQPQASGDEQRPPATDPMGGITNITSAAAGTVTFHDATSGQWVTIPKIVNGHELPLSLAVDAWRSGRTQALAQAATEDEAHTAARSWRSQPAATVP